MLSVKRVLEAWQFVGFCEKGGFVLDPSIRTIDWFREENGNYFLDALPDPYDKNNSFCEGCQPKGFPLAVQVANVDVSQIRRPHGHETEHFLGDKEELLRHQACAGRMLNVVSATAGSQEDEAMELFPLDGLDAPQAGFDEEDCQSTPSET